MDERPADFDYVQHPDDVHQAGVLEQGDELADDGRYDVANGLRQGYGYRGLPTGQAQRPGRFHLPRIQCLQASPHILRHVGGAEQRYHDTGPQQGVHRKALWERQRHQHLRHEQQGNQRNSPEHLDEHHAHQLHYRQVAAPPQRQRDAQGQAQHYAGHRQQQVEHQPAPVNHRHGLQDWDSLDAPQKHQRQQENDDSSDDDAPRGTQRGIAAHRPPGHERQGVGQQQQAHVPAHGIEVVWQEGQQRQHRGHCDADAHDEPAPVEPPAHSQQRRYQQQCRLRTPEAVLPRTGGLRVVLADNHPAAQRGYNPPVGVHDNPFQPKPKDQPNDHRG